MMAQGWQQLNYVNQHCAKLGRAGHTATVIDGRVLILAGRRSNSFFGDMVWFDPASNSWSEPVKLPWPRCANHTANLVGRHLWVLGGGDTKTVYGDARVYDVDKGKWYTPKIAGNASLLFRTAHAAVPHPCNPAAILLFGGYGGGATSWEWLNDLVVLHTDRRLVEVVAAGGVPPCPRSYHTMTAVGDRVFILGGRDADGPLEGPNLLGCLTASNDSWLAVDPPCGLPPCGRSSHRALEYQGHLLICGGATRQDAPGRMADVWVLLHAATGAVGAGGTGALQWQQLVVPPGFVGRSAHSMVLVGDQLLVLFGYAGAFVAPGSSNKFHDDAWRLDLRQGLPSPITAAAAAAGVVQEGGLQVEIANGGHTTGQVFYQQQQQQGTTPSPFKHPRATPEAHRKQQQQQQRSPLQQPSAGTEQTQQQQQQQQRSPLQHLLGPSRSPAQPQHDGAGRSPTRKRQHPAAANAKAEAAVPATTATEWRSAKRACQPRKPAAPPAAANGAAGGWQGGGDTVCCDSYQRGPQQQQQVTAGSPSLLVGGRRQPCQRCERGEGQLGASGSCGLHAATREVQALQQEVDHLRRLLCDSERSRTASEAAQGHLRQQLADQQEAAAEAWGKQSELQAALQAEQQDNRELRFQLERQQKACAAAEAAAEAATKRAEDAAASLRQQQSNTQTVRAEARKHLHDLTKLQQERDRSEAALRQELEVERAARGQAGELASSLGGELDAARGRLQQQEETIWRLTSSLTAEREAADRAKRDGDAKQQQLVAEREKQAALEQLLVAEKAAKAAYEQQVAQLQSTLQPLVSERDALKAEITRLQVQHQQGQQQLQQQLDAARTEAQQRQQQVARVVESWGHQGGLLKQVQGLVQGQVQGLLQQMTALQDSLVPSLDLNAAGASRNAAGASRLVV